MIIKSTHKKFNKNIIWKRNNYTDQNRRTKMQNNISSHNPLYRSLNLKPLNKKSFVLLKREILTSIDLWSRQKQENKRSKDTKSIRRIPKASNISLITSSFKLKFTKIINRIQNYKIKKNLTRKLFK